MHLETDFLKGFWSFDEHIWIELRADFEFKHFPLSINKKEKKKKNFSKSYQEVIEHHFS